MPTRQAFAVEMVGHEDIGNAVALNSAMFNGARVVGPAIAGLVIGAFGVAVAFLIDGFSFLAVLVALLAMRDDELHPAARIARPESPRGVMTQLREGLAYVRIDRRSSCWRSRHRRRRDVRDQLQRHHPAARRGRPRRRRRPATAS